MISKMIILEGARGTGKSTISFKLRQSMSNSTLINFTGFNDNGEEGLDKICDYYYGWVDLFRKFKANIKDQIIICDRFFPSEMVFSLLYKDYSFERDFKILSSMLPCLADEVYLFNFVNHDKKQLRQHLNRDKIPFANVEEKVEETLRQQEKYKIYINEIDNIIKGIYDEHNVFVTEIDTTDKDINEVYDLVMDKLKGEELNAI